MAPQEVPPMLTTRDASGVWIWTGFRVVAASDLTSIREYSALPDEQRRQKVVADQIGFLALHLGSPGHGAIELRWIWRPEKDAFDVFLLTRTLAANEADVGEEAEAALNRLGAAPRHVFLEALTREELSLALMPFGAVDGGAAEIRKRVMTARPQRPDARVETYVAVQPFAGSTRSWDPLLTAIGKHPHPFALSVGLEATVVGPEFSRVLGEEASNYRRLASPGEFQRGQIYGGKVSLAPDAFALEAAEIYADAARRYREKAFRIRIACYSPYPFDDSLPSAVAGIVSRDDRHDSDSYLASTALGTAYTIVRPTSEELPVFQANVQALAVTDWRPDPAWGVVHERQRVLEPLGQFVDAEEATTAFRLPVALEGTVPHFPVRSRPPAVLVDYRPTGPSLLIGRQAIGGREEASELRIEINDLTQHALILGTTGSGKTNSTLSITEQLWVDHRIPFMVLEPVNSSQDDYRWLATLPGFEELLILTVGDEQTSPLRLNPFQVPVGVRISTHMANLRMCFDAAFGLWDPLPIIYARALRRTYVEAGFDPDSVATSDERWPVLRDFIKSITNETETLDYAGEIRSNILAASRLRAESLAEGPCAATLSAQESFSTGDLMSRPVVVELAAVGDDPKEQSFIMALLLTTMTEFYKASRESSELTHVTVIEEAHRLLGGQSSTGDVKEGNAQALASERFANTLAENRKYGEGIVIVEQDPSKLVPDAYKNTNFKLMHRLPSEEDRKLIGDTMRFAADQTAYASTLPKMTAFAYHARLDRPGLVVVDDVRAADAKRREQSRATLASDEDLRSRFHQYVESSASAKRALRAQGECRMCPVRCWLEVPGRVAAKALVDKFRSAVEKYPASHDARRDWWLELLTEIDIGTEVTRPQRLQSGDRHWRSIVIAQLLSQSYSGNLSQWMAHYEHYYPSEEIPTSGEGVGGV